MLFHYIYMQQFTAILVFSQNICMSTVFFYYVHTYSIRYLQYEYIYIYKHLFNYI